MVENLEHLIRLAASRPMASRAALFKEFLRSETYLLTIDEPLAEGVSRRVTRADASFPVWADKDPELGGVWVPVFPARDRVREFVAGRGLAAPKGKEFLWMGHMPGQVFSLLRTVRGFAGLRLHLDAGTFVDVPWPEVRALCEKRPPSEAPARLELPLERLVVPAGARLSFGRLAPWPGEDAPKLLLMPDAGRLRPEDFRRLVRLPLTGGRHAWTPCRHFLQILRRLKRLGAEGSESYFEDLLTSLLAFEMYGEAEVLCEWLARRGREAVAWLGLSAVYGRSGRMAECASLCRQALLKYPSERAFYVDGIRALMALGRGAEASRLAVEAARLFPADAAVAGLSRELAALAARA